MINQLSCVETVSHTHFSVHYTASFECDIHTVSADDNMVVIMPICRWYVYSEEVPIRLTGLL